PFSMIWRSPRCTLFPYTTLFRSHARGESFEHVASRYRARTRFFEKGELPVDLGLYTEFSTPRGEETDLEGELRGIIEMDLGRWTDRKSTRLNSSHLGISYAVFCL